MTASMFGDLFKQGYREAERDAAETLSGKNNGAARYNWWDLPSCTEANRRALIELCEQQTETLALRDAEIADYAARLDEYVSAVSDRERQISALSARLDQYAAALAERDDDLRALADKLTCTEQTRDKYQTNGKRINAELRSLLEFPGAIEALQMALHPDTGQGGDVHTRTEVFKTLNAVRDRLGVKRKRK